MKSEYIIEENIINPLYENTYRDIASDLTKELDNHPIIINRIALILSNKSFRFSPITLKGIHKELFKDIYDFAGNYRSDIIERNLFEFFNKEKNIDYSQIEKENILNHIINFHYELLKLNPFTQGNVITINIFLLKYLQYYGFEITKELYKKYKLKKQD